VVVAIAAAVVVVADVASHKARAPIHKKAQMMSLKIQQRIQKRAQRAQHTAVVAVVVHLVMMSLQVRSLMKMA
jgi:hypothetical protein